MVEASQWRQDIARQIAPLYAAQAGVTAVMLASSAARGRSDRYSDLDIIVFWDDLPDELARETILSQPPFDLIRLYPYDPEWCCWSDLATWGRDQSKARQSGLALDITHYQNVTVKAWLHEVTVAHSTAEPPHNLLALLAGGRPLYGVACIKEWQKQISYPDGLAARMVRRYGQIDYFWRWRSALERGDNMLLFQRNMAQWGESLLRMLLALNRVFFFGLGWQDEVLARLALAPADFAARYQALWSLGPAEQAEALRRLIEESYDLVEIHLPEANVAWLRDVFRYQRRFWTEPPPVTKWEN